MSIQGMGNAHSVETGRASMNDLRRATGTMKAIVQRRYGATAEQVLALQDVARPEIGKDDVLLRVHAAGVNSGDIMIMRGRPLVLRAAGFGVLRPKHAIPGQDVAGRVEAIGANVQDFAPGDEVFGEIRGGAYAEYACAPSHLIAPKPANLTLEQAAAVPIAGLAALQALRDVGKVQAGHKVLIIGASGGVGTFAVQIAKSVGAEVTGVCSTRNVEMVRSIGADHVIDYAQEDFAATGQRYDFILDNVADRTLGELRHLLAHGGTLVPNSSAGGLRRVFASVALSPVVGQNLRPFISLPNKQDLLALKDLLEAGRIEPIIDRTYPLAETAAALAYVAEGHARGKVVITIPGATG
jgi:NADPH:quinone reductase-like Zn-dependent oxidoreductase